jgi:hypothetical protein
MAANKRSWDIFNGWTFNFAKQLYLPKKDWADFDILAQFLDEYYLVEEKEIISLLEVYDKKLFDLGGDPSYSNWEYFRPLRLDREEDWSDWLIHLIAKSETGYFCQKLLRIDHFSESDYALPLVYDREIAYEGFRADIVIEWQNENFTHIEVKIGDQNFAKTPGTADRMRKKYRSDLKSWSNFILLLSYQMAPWEETRKTFDMDIRSITWEDVAISIRKSLQFSNENIQWKVWACPFLGAVEQKLLGFPAVDRKKKKIQNSFVIDTMKRILKEGAKNE